MNNKMLFGIGLSLVLCVLTVPAATAAKAKPGLTVSVKLTEGFESIICVEFDGQELVCKTTDGGTDKVKFTRLAVPNGEVFQVFLYGEYKTDFLDSVTGKNHKGNRPETVDLRQCGSNEIFSHIDGDSVYCTDLLDDSGSGSNNSSNDGPIQCLKGDVNGCEDWRDDLIITRPPGTAPSDDGDTVFQDPSGDDFSRAIDDLGRTVDDLEKDDDSDEKGESDTVIEGENGG